MIVIRKVPERSILWSNIMLNKQKELHSAIVADPALTKRYSGVDNIFVDVVTQRASDETDVRLLK
jgi:hypothetical protein